LIADLFIFSSAFHEIVRRKQMTRNKRFVLAVAVAGATALTSISAEAFFGPFNFMRGWGGGGGPWGWGGPWGGYGWGGYPYYGGYGGWGGYGGYGGYPYGGWGYPYGGWGGSPYWGGVPYMGYPAVAAPAPAAPASSSDK
jgi:hypothetical protein